MKNHKEHLVQAGYKPSYAAMKTRLEARDCASGRLAPAPGGAAGQLVSPLLELEAWTGSLHSNSNSAPINRVT